MEENEIFSDEELFFFLIVVNSVFQLYFYLKVMVLSVVVLVVDYLVFLLISVRYYVIQWSVIFFGGEFFEGLRFKV